MTEAEKKKPGKKSLISFFFKISIAVGIITWLIFKNYQKILFSLSQIKYEWFILAFGLYVIHLFAGAWRWHMLMKAQNIKIGFRETFSLLMQGFFFSLVIPGGAIGGDVAKAGFLISRTPKGDRLKGVFTILIDRIIGMIALFSFAGFLGIISYGFLKGLGGALELTVYALLSGCFIGLCSVFILLFHRQLEKIGPISWLLAFGDRYSKGALSNMMKALDVFRSKKKVLILCLIISIVFVHMNIAVVIICIGKGLGVQNVPGKLLFLSATLGNAAGAIPVTPSGLGTRDLVLKNLLEAVGVKQQAATIPLIYDVIVIICSLSGSVFFLLKKNRINKPDSLAYL